MLFAQLFQVYLPRLKLDTSVTFSTPRVTKQKTNNSHQATDNLAGSSEGAGGTNSAQLLYLAVVNSVAEYSAPMWCRSDEIRLIENQLMIFCSE